MTSTTPRASIPEWVASLADSYGEGEAIVAGARRERYRDVDARSAEIGAGLLGRGVPKYARIGVLAANGPDWLVGSLAVMRIGAVTVPLSTLSRGPELARAIRHADLHGLLVTGRLAGRDELAVLAEALPELTGSAPGTLSIAAAPFLRWIVTLDDVDEPPGWAHSREWLVAPGRAELLAAAQGDVHAEDPATMIHTSGTTADPKGVLHSHGNLVTKIRYIAHTARFEPATRAYTSMPFFWVGGLIMVLLPTLEVGGTVFCTERFDAGQVLELVERERIERLYLYPATQRVTFREHPDFPVRDRSSLRFAHRGMTVGRWTPANAPARDPDGLDMGLGMSETLGPYWWGSFDEHDTVVPPLERLQPGVELKVVDEQGTPAADGTIGEIRIRGTCVTAGLHKTPRDSYADADGFYRTGDAGLIDGERVRFRGRLSETIKSAGANVAPAEVVEALRCLDGIADAHVVGLPEHERGELVAAAVVVEPGRVLRADDLRAQLRTRMSPFKVPSIIEFFAAAEIPTTDSGKLRPAALRQLIRMRQSAVAPRHDEPVSSARARLPARALEQDEPSPPRSTRG